MFYSNILYTVKDVSIMNQKNAACDFGCPVEAALAVIGGKWKGIILYHLRSDVRRFNELRRLIPNVTQRMLTKQLRELEADQIIHRKIFQLSPRQAFYDLHQMILWSVVF